MSETTDHPTGTAARRDRFRQAIADFIDTRRTAKLKGREDDTAAAAKYEYETWLASAARRVGQIQAVTHVLKASHPDARGSSLYIPPTDLPTRDEIGSHSLGSDFTDDVVGNAAALDVFKFLKVEVDGRALLDWVKQDDPDLKQALHADANTADERMQAFGNLVRSGAPSSHALAKQVYWLVDGRPDDNRNFHLLQPLFSSALAHRVHADIQAARFGEGNKALRQAKKSDKPHDGIYRDYRQLAVRKMGGTKPQNISQLTSERRGTNYLLASLPPTWSRMRAITLLELESSTRQFFSFEGVRDLLRRLVQLLQSDPKRTMETRQKREAIEQALGARLPLFAATIRDQLSAGWTRDPTCELPLCEQLWLDPDRLTLNKRPAGEGGEADHAFEQAYHWGDWPDDVAGIFANWLNEQLRRVGVTSVGDMEYRHWARQAIVDAAWPIPMQRRAPEDRS